MTNTTPAARLGQATLGNSAWYLDQLITFLAIGEDTDGRFALLRVRGIQGAEPPAHVHTHEDETIYLLQGELTVSASGERLHACPGDTVTIPRGVEHTVRHDTVEVLFLLQFSPAGFERYFHEMSEPAEYLGLPPHPVPLDRARMVVTAAQYGCVFTGLSPGSVRQNG
jgi:quercetin dioxygenase-like cupin family protein